ncbi:hypothetical protein [Brumimicrobium oceani]|uniref:Uncharacterized protein n=1 Tax=Brumimicrobium oceani TaxID=2100725 RepID=A0A2U2XH21_9FLAO|nr:hypothetical protein [Brumimicrobium oceani]PWH87098.1 hypothetical protein DIT68_02220 [Brumimicrobium oceani]
MRLAGTYHPIPYILERVTEFLPGVTVVSAIWLDYDKQIYSTNEGIPLNNYLKVKAQNIRNTQLNSEWTTNPEPFTEDKKSKNQLTFEDEDELNVLRLYFPSPIDSFKDVVSIAFPQNVFLKSLNSKFKGMSTQEKHILSHILSSIFSAEHTRVVQERDFLESVQHINRKKDLRIKQLTDDLKSTEQLYSSSIRNIINDFKNKLEKELKKLFVINNEVIFKLAKERLTIDQIELIIKNSVYLAYNLNISDDTIQVTVDHVQLNKLKQPENKPKTTINQNDGKTSFLLDKYEEAALRAAALGLSINGKNVAAQLDPPVTPPAITDAIKKKKSKIAYLLQQYPEKWMNIRKAIRPISLLDQSSNQNASTRVSNVS